MATGALIASNPAIAGGTTAFLVTMGFISANALWYQPHVHDGVFFRTRPDLVFKPIKPENIVLGSSSKNQPPADAPIRKVKSVPVPQSPDPIAAAINGDPVLAPGGDPEVAKLQQKLLALGFYTGTVDGISGKGTRAAIDAYRKATADMGIEAPNQTVDNAGRNHGQHRCTGEKAGTVPGKGYRTEDFDKLLRKTVQPMRPHGGLSPAEIVRIQAGPAGIRQ